MKIKLIAAVDLDGGIGKDGQMPWPRLKTDLKRFKDLTTGHPIIMGRVTAESIGKPLPNRTNIVLSRSMTPNTGGFGLIASDLNDALNLAMKADEKECWIIGGAEVYELGMLIADEIHLTIIRGRYDCDRFLPKVNIFEWEYNESDDDSVDSDAVPYAYRLFRRDKSLA